MGDWFPFGEKTSVFRTRNSITKTMISNENEEKDVWFPFGERNDPKLRRSFNRGVRYAGHPRTLNLKTTPTPTQTTTDVSINPEIQEKCGNSENEKPNIVFAASAAAVVENRITATPQSNMENKSINLDKAENIFSKPSRQIERSISTSTTPTTTDFENNFCQTSTSKCFCCCRSYSSAANTQNGGSIENIMSSSMSQPSTHCCSNNNFSSSSSPFIPPPTTPLHNSYNCTSPFQQHWPFHPPNFWPHSPFNIPPTSPASSFASSNSLTNPSTSPLLVYQLVPIDMVSGLPAIIPQAGSPQFVYATSINGQPVPVSIHQPEREQRRDSKISLPPIFNFSQPFTTPASPTTSETTSSLSWNSEHDKQEIVTSAGIGNNENSWKMEEEMPNLHLSQCFETKKPKNHCLEPLKLKEVPKQKKDYEHEKVEEKLPLRTPSPVDKRPIRPSPGGRYQIPDLPGEDLYHAVPIKEKETTPKKEKNNNNSNTEDSPKKRSPSDLGLFSSVEIRSPLRRRSDMLPPRPPTRNTSMTKLASQLSPKATTPPADFRRATKPPLPSSDSCNSINTDSNLQESPRTFFTRNKQYRSFNVKTTNVGVNPAVEHLKMLKQKLLDHQQVIKNRGVFQQREV